MWVKLIYNLDYTGRHLKFPQTTLLKFDNFEHLQHYLDNDNCSDYLIQ